MYHITEAELTLFLLLCIKSMFFFLVEAVFRAVLQKLSGEHDGRDAPFLLSLGCHSKQVGDERDLPQNVPFLHGTHLPLPDHVHGLIPS